MLKSNKIIIISDSGKDVGLGHYSRSKYLSEELKTFFKKKIQIKNILLQKKIFLKDKNFINVSIEKNFYVKIFKFIEIFKPTHIIFNVSKKFENKYIELLLKKIKSKHSYINLIAIDGCIKFKTYFKKIWIPNVYLKRKNRYKNIYYGWDKILFKKIEKNKKKNKKKILILLGGTDTYNFSKKLPQILTKFFDHKFSISWLQGPFAPKPKLKKFNNWKVLKGKLDIHKEILKANIVLVLFGVSFFEVVSLSKPCVVLFPKRKENHNLIDEVSKKGFEITKNLTHACKKLRQISDNYEKSFKKANKLSVVLKKINRKRLYKNILS